MGNQRKTGVYVDISGKELDVVVSDEGEILIPAAELQKCGFSIYLKSQYNKLLMEEKDFDDAFYIYILNCSQKYMLENKFHFNENQVIETIQKAKLALTKNVNELSNSNQNQSCNGRIVAEIDNDSFQIQVPNKSTNKENISSAAGSSSSKLTTQNLNLHNKRFEQTINSPSNSNTPTNNKHKPLLGINHGTPRTNIFDNRSNQTSKKKDDAISNLAKEGENNNSFNKQKRFSNNSNNSPNINLRTPRDNVSNVDSEVRSKGSDEKPKQRIIYSTAHLELEKDIEVIISYLDEEKPRVMWVQPIANSMLLEITEQLNQEVENVDYTTPILGQMYASQDNENIWYRCKIIHMNPLKALFVDYGNVEIIDKVKPLSKQLAEYPQQAVRVSFSPQHFSNPQVESTIIIKPKQKFDDGTYYIYYVKTIDGLSPNDSFEETKPVQHNEPEVIKSFFKLPPRLEQLSNGVEVKVINFTDGKLYLRTQRCYESLRQNSEIIKNLKAERLSNVKKGQLILANKNPQGLCRAVVNSIENYNLNITFFDFGENVTIDKNEAYSITKELSEKPITCLEAPPLRGFPNGFSSEQIMGINEWIANQHQNKKKCKVLLEPPFLDLEMDGVFLSNKLKALEKPKQKPPQRVNNSIDNFDKIIPNVGSLDGCLIGHYQNMDDVTVIPGAVTESYIEDVIKTEIKDMNPYSPNIGEVCLGFFGNLWYRCVITNKSGSKFFGRLVDFGNHVDLTSDEVRKLSSDLTNIPIIGVKCKLRGIENNPKNHKALVEKLEDGSAFDVLFKNGSKDGIYEIEIPSLEL